MNCTTTLTSTQHCPLPLPLWGKAKSSTSDADWSEKERFSTVEAQNDRKAGHQLNNIFVVISTTIWIDCNRNWRAPWKAGVSTYFVAIFRVARNPLKFGMPILFVLKNAPVFFFKAEKYGPNYTKIHPPLPLCPSPNIVGFRLFGTKTLCMCVCFTPLEGGGGRGGQKGGCGLSRVCLKPRFPACGKKHRDIFWHKKSQHAKFQRIPSNLKKSQRNRYIRLPSTEPFNWYLKFISHPYSCFSITTFQSTAWLQSTYAF